MNNIFEINLIITIGVCFIFWFIFLRLTRSIVTMIGPDGPNNIAGGDNGNLIRVTSESSKWKWPSDMHIKTPVGTSTYQRDITVLLLILFQKMFRDKKSEYPIVALWSFAHAASVFIIYLIGSIFWGPNIALLISIFYLSSFWLWQMSLWVGHLNVGTMFFLLAVYLVSLSIHANLATTYLLLVGAGFSFCCMLYASSSSPRYILPFFGAILLVRNIAANNSLSIHGFYRTIVDNNSFFLSIVFTIIIAVCLFLIKFYYKKIIAAAYYKRAWIFNGLIEARKYPLDHYLEKARIIIGKDSIRIIKPYIFLFIVFNILGSRYFFPLFTGFLIVFFALNLPNIKRNIMFYFNYLYISYLKPGSNSGLVRYVRYGYFTKNKIKIPANLRGGGFWWVPKIFFKMAPFHTLIYLAIVCTMVVSAVFWTPPILGISSFFLLVVFSISPILWAELTKAYQVSRSYSSGLIGFFVVIGTGAYSLQKYPHFWSISLGLLTLTFAWNLWKFFNEVYPARMSFNKIVKSFQKLGVKEIYTYKTFYNDSFLYNIELTPLLKNLKINFINSIKEVPNGWIFIPPTTHKAGYIRQEESIEQGDFTKDPVLNNLLETKEIEKIATTKFKTVYGSDDIWLQEADIMTYLDLMANFITNEDHFRGYAWLLHSSKLPKWTK